MLRARLKSLRDKQEEAELVRQAELARIKAEEEKEEETKVVKKSKKK